MSQFYSDPARESDEFAMPDCEVFQMTAEEVAESSIYEDEQYEFARRHEFRLAGMNSRTRDKMLAAMIDELGITGGWFYWLCFPGCMPDSCPMGPYDTRQQAIDAAREEVAS